jgi:PhnB protein
MTTTRHESGSTLDNPPPGMPRIVPHLIYDDIDAAVTFLRDAFGFTERTEHRHTTEDGTIGRTQLDVVDSVITVGLPSIHADSPAKGVSSMLYIYVDDVDGHYERAVAAGATIVSELADAPWGDRRYQATDPQGHQWSFGQPVHSHGDDCD